MEDTLQVVKNVLFAPLVFVGIIIAIMIVGTVILKFSDRFCTNRGHYVFLVVSALIFVGIGNNNMDSLGYFVFGTLLGLIWGIVAKRINERRKRENEPSIIIPRQSSEDLD